MLCWKTVRVLYILRGEAVAELVVDPLRKSNGLDVGVNVAPDAEGEEGS